MGIKQGKQPARPEDVDLRIGNHDMPVLISAMSFGSQGELSYRTYAEAARDLNIICMNGEGGELPDMLGKLLANYVVQKSAPKEEETVPKETVSS